MSDLYFAFALGMQFGMLQANAEVASECPADNCEYDPTTGECAKDGCPL